MHKRLFLVGSTKAVWRAGFDVAWLTLALAGLGPSLLAQFTYTNDNGAITITQYTGPGGDVVIPQMIDGLPVVGLAYQAFWHCTTVSNVTIPATVTNIVKPCFQGCARLHAITVEDSNPVYRSLEGVLFDRSQTTLIRYPATRTGEYAVPEGVATIDYGAFSGNSHLTRVIIPEGVTKLGAEAFESCTGLTNFTIPESLTSISSEAFLFCSGLIEIRIPKAVASIGTSAFYGCASLQAINVDALNSKYCSIDGVLLSGSRTTLIRCPGGKGGAYSIPEGVWRLDFAAFAGCGGLTSIAFPASLASPVASVFLGCTNLTAILVDAANASCSSVDGLLLNQPQTLLRYCPGGRTGTCLVPDTVTNVSSSAFADCPGLVAIQAGEFNPALSSVDGVLFNKPQTQLIVCPSGKTGTYHIPSATTNILISAFSACPGLTALAVDESNPAFRSVDGVLFDKQQTNLVRFPGGRAGSYSIPEGVAVVGNEAFFGCPGLTRIMVPPEVGRIGTYGFGNCASLREVVFKGDAPKYIALYDPFEKTANAVVYYLPGSTGWKAVFGSRPTVPWNPLMPTGAAEFGVRANEFTFPITGASNLTVVVEACVDLTTSAWTAVATNVLTEGTAIFHDPGWTNQPARFYRLRSP